MFPTSAAVAVQRRISLSRDDVPTTVNELVGGGSVGSAGTTVTVNVISSDSAGGASGSTSGSSASTSYWNVCPEIITSVGGLEVIVGAILASIAVTWKVARSYAPS